MSGFLIFILFFIPLNFIILISLFIFWYVSNEKKVEKKLEKFTMFFIYDLNSNKYYYEKKIDKQKNIFKKSKAKKWNKFSNITENFDSKIKKQFANVQNKLKNGSIKERLKFSIEKNNSNNSKKNFEFNFNKLYQETDYLLTIKFNVVKKYKKNKQKLIKEINKNDLIKDKHIYKGFIGFNVLNNSKKNHNRIIENLSKICYSKKMNYFFSNKIIIIVVFGNNHFVINKKIEKIENKILNRGIKIGIKSMYYGSGTTIFKGLNNIEEFNEIIQKLNSLIDLSIIKKKNSINNKNEFKNNNLIDVANASKVFFNAMKMENIKTNKVIVKNWKTNNKIIDYIFPKINGLSTELLESITINENNKKNITDKYANLVGFDQKITEMCLLDVYDYWIFKNINNNINKKIIYVIHLSEYKSGSKLIKLINKIRYQNIKFAIYINNLNDYIFTIIQSINPVYVIVDKKIWNSNNFLNSKNYMQILTLKSLSEKNELKLIYQNPFEIMNVISDKINQKIGLKYYYKR